MIYLDNSATTKPCKQAVSAAEAAMTTAFGNPSSLYSLGLQAEALVEDARAVIAALLWAREDEIYFTSCGSESNNTAIFGAAALLSRRGRHIVTTAVEHPSVLQPMKKLEQEGYEITYLQPGADGNISLCQFENAIRPDTILVSCMAVNNETGAIFPVHQLKSIIKSKGSFGLLHIDAVQAFGKQKLEMPSLNADLLSVSAHKIHGIKGAGALYVKKGIALPGFVLGGGQEKGLRSGTEAVPAIAAFGAAVHALPDIQKQYAVMQALHSYCRQQLEQFDNVRIHSGEQALPYIFNFSFTGYRSETLLHFLEQRDIFVSSGSACSKGKGSHVLREMGLPADLVDSALRISFSRETTQDDIDQLCAALRETVTLRGTGRQASQKR